MSKYFWGLFTNTYSKEQKCCMCGKGIKKDEEYVITLAGEKLKEYDYCKDCWNDWAYMNELPSWEEALEKIEKAKKQKEMT